MKILSLELTRESFYVQKALMELRKGNFYYADVAFLEGKPVLVLQWGGRLFTRSIYMNSITATMDLFHGLNTTTINDENSQWKRFIPEEKNIYYVVDLIEDIERREFRELLEMYNSDSPFHITIEVEVSKTEIQ